MTTRESIQDALCGRNPDGAPFAPRMDLWYIANRERGTLPAGLEELDLPRLARKLGVGCHALKADHTLPRPMQDFTLLGLGLENHAHFPFEFAWDGLDVGFAEEAGRIDTRVHTPRGDLHMYMEFTSEMRGRGISMPFVNRYPLRAASDIEILCHAFERIRVIPRPGRYRAFREHVGDAGPAVASGMPAASPMHLVLHNIAGIQDFFFLYHDEPDLMAKLAAAIEPVFEAVLDAVLGCGAEFFYWGSNYDRHLTYPPFFEKEIAPWLTRAATAAHAKGIRLLTHADGDNASLLPFYPACGVDVMESVCTEPMIPISMRELREAVSGRCALWGGVPSVVLLKDQWPDAQFDAFLDGFFEQLGDGRGCVIGVSDNVPPDADLDRLRRIRDRCHSFEERLG